MKTKFRSSARVLMVLVWLCHAFTPVFSVAAQETPPDPLSPPASSAPLEPEWIARDFDDTADTPRLPTTSTANAPLAPAQIECDGAIHDLIVNGGFEESEAWYGAATGDAIVGYDSALAHNGEHSFALVGATDADLFVGQTVTFTGQVNQAVLSFYLRQDRTGAGDELYSLIFDEEFINLLGWAYLPDNETSNTWEPISLSFTPILTDVVGQTVQVVFFAFMDDADHTTYHIDDVSLEICIPSFGTPSLTNNGFEDGESPWLLEGDAVIDDAQAHDGSASVKLGGYPGTAAQAQALGLPDADQRITPTARPRITAQDEAVCVPLKVMTSTSSPPATEDTVSSTPLNLDEILEGSHSSLSPLASVNGLQQGGEQVLQNPGFETGAWTPWYIYGYPDLVYDVSPGGDWSWMAHLGGYNYANDQTWQTISIPANATEVYFDFWFALGTDESLHGYDSFCVAIWDSGGSPYVVRCADFGDINGFLNWTRETYVLSANELQSIVGKTVNFGFIVETDVSSPSQAWVDDTAFYIVAPSSPPEASFSASPTSGEAPLTVNFSDTSTGDLASWSWDFGDGSSSTLQNPTHTYDSAGTYTAELTVTGPGGSDNAEQTITVENSSYGYGRVSQAFTIAPDTRQLKLDFWLGAVADTDSNDEIYALLYNTDFSEILGGWQIYPMPGYWAPSTWWTFLNLYKIPVDPSWHGQTVNLAFVSFNDAHAPHSAFWIDDVTLMQCPESPYVSNTFIRADVDGEDGTFVIGTTGGDPNTSNDDNLELLYSFEADGYSSPWSSITTLRVVSGTEASDYVLSNVLPVVAPHQEGDAVITRWRIDGIVVTQSLSLAPNPHTNEENVVQIAYDVENESSSAYDVGLRSLLDVKIGENDGAPYFVPGYGNLIHETDFIGDDVPAYWKAFESPIFDATYLRGQGILRGGDATPPDRMVIAEWPSLGGKVWDYSIQQGQVVTDDSAVALYWNPTPLYYAESTRFVTYYGLAGRGGGDTWLDAPASVACGDLEFDVVQWVNNATASTLTGGQSTLTLPDDVSLVHGEDASKAWGDILPGEARSVQWRVAATGDIASTATLQAEATFSGGVTRAASVQVAVPRCETQLDKPTGLEAYPGIDSISLRWEPSPSPGVEGYHVYRKAGGSTAFPPNPITTMPVRNTSYRDNDTLTEGETYVYYVTAVVESDESDPSNEAEAVFGQLSLAIPPVYASQGTTVTVPINIANADGLRIGAIDIYLDYPTDLLSLAPEGVQSTLLSEGYLFKAESDSGIVAVHLVSGDAPLYGEGTLFNLVFEVIGTIGKTGELRFDRDETAIYSTEDLYNPVPSALQDGQITVRRNFKLGDLSGDGKIRANDVAIALLIAVGKIKPTEEQSSAGNVNGDDYINSADVVRILHMIDTVPSSQTRMATHAATDTPVTLSVEEGQGLQGGTAWVSINVDNAADIAGSDLTINYDPDVLEIAESEAVQRTDMTQAFDLETHSSKSGVLKIALATAQTLTGGSGALVKVQFTIKRSAPDGATPVTLASAQLNDTYGQDFATSALQRPVNRSSGQVFIGSSYMEQIFLPLVMRKK